jgi:hypothetical protein
MDLKTALDILNLDAAATLSEAKKAYRTLAKQYHPDVMGKTDAAPKDAEARMKDINLAFRYLAPFLKLNEPVKKTSVKTPDAESTGEKPETVKTWGAVFDHCSQLLTRFFVQQKPSRDMPKTPPPPKQGLKRNKENFRTVLKNIKTGTLTDEKKISGLPKKKKPSPKPSFGYYQRYRELKQTMKSGRSGKGTETSVSPITEIEPVTRVNAVGKD